MRLHRPPYRLLATIMALRLVAALGFALNSPLWEHSDEINHYRYAYFIVRQGRLPTRADAPQVPQGYEIYLQFDQPPLYYLLLAPAIALVDDDFIRAVQANPFAICDRPFEAYYLHSLAERFPPVGTALAAWLDRLLTIAIGAAAVIFVWLAARWLYPRDEALAVLAAALFAWMPATLEFTAWLNNDAPLLLTGALFLAGLARWLQKPDRWAAGLLFSGLLCSVATKLTGLALLPVALWIGIRWARMQTRRMILSIAGIIVLVAGFVALNLAHCDAPICRLHRYTLPFQDLSGLANTLFRADIYKNALAQLSATLTIPTISDQFPPSPLLMLIGIGIILAGLAGSAVHYHRTRNRELPWLWALIASAIILAVIRVWWLQVGYFQARYLAAALPVLAILLALGHTQFSRRLAWTVAAVFLLASLLIPLAYYRPAFPAVERSAALPAEATRVDDFVFDDRLQLGGYQRLLAQNGQSRLRVFWRTLEPLDEAYFAMITRYDEDMAYLDRCGMTMGSAFWTTRDWLPDEWVAQDFAFGDDAPAEGLTVQVYGISQEAYIVSTYDPEHPLPRTGSGFLRLPDAADSQGS